MAKGWEEASRIKNGLAENGLLVVLRKSAATRGNATDLVELMAPEIEAKEAHMIITDLLNSARAF